MKKAICLLLFLSLLVLASKYTGSDLPENTFSLTFDDGPDERTLKVLDDLDKFNIKATFFVVGNMTKGREWIVREEIARGHQVGCHTMTHPLMTKLKKTEWEKEINDCVKIVTKIIGKKPTLFRFPYGASTIEMEEYAESYGMKVIYWNIDSLDWEKSPEEEIKYIEDGIKNKKKGIILMHDIQKSTEKSLPEILEFLENRKARFVLLNS